MQHELEKEEQISSTAVPTQSNRNFVTTSFLFVAGAGVGAAVALLFAPLSGRQTHNVIAQNVATAGRKVQAQAHDLVDKGQDLVGKGKALVDTGKDHLSRAFAVGKEASREQKSASS